MKPPGYQRIRMGNQLRVGNFLRQFIRIYAEDLAQASYSEVEEAPSSSIVNPIFDTSCCCILFPLVGP